LSLEMNPRENRSMSNISVIPLGASPQVRNALERIGRCEDVSFSPDNRRLALACLERNSVAILDVTITNSGNRARVAVNDVAEYSSSCLAVPHGVEFLDDETILVANREGKVVAFRLPSKASALEEAELAPIDLVPGNDFEHLSAPGSIAVIRDQGVPLEVLICDNRNDTVTRHLLEGGSFRVLSNDILLRHLLDFPDGVAVTDDNRWIAISNREAHVVMLYERGSALSEHSAPDCMLRGTMYPHGLQFSASGAHLFVADAGRSHVNIYSRDDDTWRGVHHPKASVRVMSDEIFELGRDAGSRRPKGIAFDQHGCVVAVTFEKQPLAFFDVCEMLEQTDGRQPDQDLLLRYEVEALEQGRARLEQRVAWVTESTSFRITKPIRLIKSAWLKYRR
jgi:Lactonase, 7-bladed beta-propeller